MERTRTLLFDVYKMASMTDPRVVKDENTRGLLINYAASYLALASEYEKAGDNRNALRVLEAALKFDLDRDRKVPLFYHASVFAMLSADYDKALAYLDTIRAQGINDPELSLRRGYAWQGKGDFQQAEAEFRAAISGDPNRPEAVQALYRMYLDDVHDTAKARAVLQEWLRRAPKDSLAAKVLREIS